MACDHRKALDLAKAGDWHGAHEQVQEFGDPASCLIHAYLHRVEGDEENARYWYDRAGAKPFTGSHEEELAHLYAAL